MSVADIRQRLHFAAMMLFTGLEAVALLLGVVTYAGNPFGFIYPRLFLGSIVAMTLIVVAARVAPALRRRWRMVRSLEVIALLVYATSLTVSTGTINTPFVALYAITLLAAALVWTLRQVLVLAVMILALTPLQTGFFNLLADMPMFTTVMVLLNTLLPAAAAAVVIATLRGVEEVKGQRPDRGAARVNAGALQPPP
jgi:hypothetical protein